MALEVVWPPHKWDYLTVADSDMPVNPPPLSSTWAGANGGHATPTRSKRRRAHRTGPGDRTPAAVDPTHQQGRALAVHAFLQGAQCRVSRVSALLGVSTRSVGRHRARPRLTTRPILEVAQTCIAASADRGSTPAERAAAAVWLAGEAAPAPVEPEYCCFETAVLRAPMEVSSPPCDDGHLRDRVQEENSVPELMGDTRISHAVDTCQAAPMPSTSCSTEIGRPPLSRESSGAELAADTF